MGMLNTKPHADTIITTPSIRTPFTDGFSTVGHYDGTECADFELNMLDCFEAMGPIRGKEHCKLYFQDFKECTHKWKQMHRIEDMRTERRKQWLKGMMGQGPKVPLSAGCPPMDGVATETFLDFSK